MADTGAIGGPFVPAAPSSTASLSDMLTAVKNLVQATNNLVLQYTQTTPDFSSGQITATVAGTLVQTGYVRLLGVSIITGTTAGGLYNSATIAGATAGTQVGALLTTPGFYNYTSMIFQNGLVAKPSAGQIVSLHYARS